MAEELSGDGALARLFDVLGDDSPPTDVLVRLLQYCGGHVEKAINLYFQDPSLPSLRREARPRCAGKRASDPARATPPPRKRPRHHPPCPAGQGTLSRLVSGPKSKEKKEGADSHRDHSEAPRVPLEGPAKKGINPSPTVPTQGVSGQAACVLSKTRGPSDAERDPLIVPQRAKVAKRQRTIGSFLDTSDKGPQATDDHKVHRVDIRCWDGKRERRLHLEAFETRVPCSFVPNVFSTQLCSRLLEVLETESRTWSRPEWNVFDNPGYGHHTSCGYNLGGGTRIHEPTTSPVSAGGELELSEEPGNASLRDLDGYGAFTLIHYHFVFS